MLLDANASLSFNSYLPLHYHPGYYSRFAALRKLLLDFIKQTSTSSKRQIIVLGAGFDTTFFQLTAEGTLLERTNGDTTSTLYLELDFQDVTQRKSAAIQHIPALLQTLQGKIDIIEENDNPQAAVQIDCEHGEVLSSRYSLLPADLRETDQVEAALARAGINYSVPTFILAECVLVYMHPQQSDNLLRLLGQNFSKSAAAMVLYEQVNPGDAFGRQMMMNLSARGCPLLGIMSSVEAHKERFLKAGWGRAEVKTMNEIYKSCLDPNDVRRIQKLEIFDEFEEWNLIQDHYCIAVGVVGTSNNGNGKDGGDDVLKEVGLHEAKDPRIAALEAILVSKRKTGS
jgi:tRNA wybutosine-synthesizing protein 4